MRDEKDRSGKWLLEHFGDRVLTGLAGVTESIEAWKSLQVEVVQPKQQPDGLLEVRFAGRKKSDRFLIEIATYPEQRVSEQMMRDTALVYLDQRQLPEVVTLVLAERGQQSVSGAAAQVSRLGWTAWKLKWKVVNLWEVPAEELLALNDVGLIPWVPLTKFKGNSEALLRECRRRIEKKAATKEQGNLLAVTQILGRLRFDVETLAAIFGEKRGMIESPFIKEVLDEVLGEMLEDPKIIQSSPIFQRVINETRNDVLEVLTRRFEKVPQDVTTALRGITSPEKLRALVKEAAFCPSLKEFRKHLKS